MSMPKAWTLEELHRLPDDGNKYELIRGELFVTPPPSVGHEVVLARLHRMLAAYVHQNALGEVFGPRAVVRFDDSEAEPDLMVRSASDIRGNEWELLPAPLLVVEVLSPTTRRRDLVSKREFYLNAGAGEYWIIDTERREVRVVRSRQADTVERERLTWRADAHSPFHVELAALFD